MSNSSAALTAAQRVLLHSPGYGRVLDTVLVFKRVQ